MQTKILVLTIAAGCFAAGYYTRVAIVDERHDALAKMIEQQQARQKQMYADMDRAIKNGQAVNGNDFVKFQKMKLH